MQEPLVSILIPFKDTENYIADCLISIIKQSYNNWELIIVNDHSNDSSYNIVKGFAEADSRIRLLHNPGHGIIEALRYAFSCCNGDFVTRMDSDDIMRIDKLKTLSTLLQQFGKAHIAIGPVHYFSKKGIGSGYESYEKWLNQLIAGGTNYSEIYKECVIPSPSWMLHKSDLESIDAFNPNRYPEDYDLAFRCYEKQLKCIPCSQVLHEWRDYASRTSRTHEHYAENHFIDLKLHYFLKLDYNKERSLVVWGAGKKGKKVAKTLINANISFHWICDNPKKVGKDIYGKVMRNFDYLQELHNPQSIITVANRKAQMEITSYMKQQRHLPMLDYFFFC